MREGEPRRYLFLLVKWWWLVVLCTLLAGGVAYGVSRSLQPIYQATATLVLEQSGTSLSNYLLRNSQWEPETYTALLPILLPETSTRLGIAAIPPENISVEAVRDSRVLYLRVRDPDPQRAADIANTIPVAFDEYTESLLLDTFSEMKASLSKEMEQLEGDIATTQSRVDAIGQAATPAEAEELKRLETALSQYRYNYGQLLASYEQVRLSETQSRGSLVIFKQAGVPSSPAFPQTRRNTLLASLVGMILAVGVIFLFEYLDDSIKTPEDVSRVMGRNLLGSIAVIHPRHRGENIQPLVARFEPRSPLSEAFRGLRTNVRFASVDRPMGRLLVTSSKPSEGKSLVAANLATVFAQGGHSVVLVDCDLRRPKQHTLFAVPNSGGVTNALLDAPDAEVSEWLQDTPVENLHLMTSGPIPPNPAELVGSRRMGELVERLKENHDVVIVDSPPLLAVTDAALLSRQVDGVLVVLAAGNTKEREARRALEDLTKVTAPVLGVVLNKVPSNRHGEYGHEYYYSQYAYSSSEEKASGRKKLRVGELFTGSHRSNGHKHPSPSAAEEKVSPSEGKPR